MPGHESPHDEDSAADDAADDPAADAADDASDDADGIADGIADELDAELDAPIALQVDAPAAGRRIDVLIAERAGVARAQVQRWIEAGRVEIGGRPVARASRLAVAGEEIRALPLPPIEMSLAPEAIALEVLFEDSDLIVIDKPPGLVVHPAPGHATGTLVNALLHHCRGQLSGIGGVLRPGIVHRLDRGTSGVLVAAKTDLAHQGLAVQFASHSIERVYRTFVRGLPRADRGRIDRPIGRHPEDRQRMSVRTRSGRRAATNWRVLARDHANGIAELEIRPETGRTHQIRVHLASAGLPLVGDEVYGRARGTDARLGRPALHAERLGFTHPRSGMRQTFAAPLPPDLAGLVASLALEPTSPASPDRGHPARGGAER